MAEYALRIRQAREAAKRFGKATARGDCYTAQKHKSAYLKAVSLLQTVLPRALTTKYEGALSRMDDKLERCYVRTGQRSAGR